MATFGVTLVTEKDSMELGERLRNGTKHLIYLNRKRGSSTGRRRHSPKAQGDKFNAENIQSVATFREKPKVTVWDEDSEDEEIISVTMLDDVVTKCAATEYSFVREDAMALVGKFGVYERILVTERRQRTLELLYKPEENMHDSILRAVHITERSIQRWLCVCYSSPVTTQLNVRGLSPELRVQHGSLQIANMADKFKERQDIANAENIAIQEIMRHTATKIVDDVVCCTAKNESTQAESEGVHIVEIMDEEPTLKGWRKFLSACCPCITNADQQKKKRPGVLKRLRSLFKL